MKFTLWTIAVSLALLNLSCGKTDIKPANAAADNHATPFPPPATPKDGNYNGKGTVTKINLDLVSVELNHENIEGLMPAMQMEFYVTDKVLLKGLTIGDRALAEGAVEFKLRNDTGKRH